MLAADPVELTFLDPNPEMLLKPGVLVHIRDIFAGWQYPAEWEAPMFNDLCAKVGRGGGGGVEPVAAAGIRRAQAELTMRKIGDLTCIKSARLIIVSRMRLTAMFVSCDLALFSSLTLSGQSSIWAIPPR